MSGAARCRRARRSASPFLPTEPVDLKLQTFDGTIVVRSWDKNEVLVEIERRGPDQSAAEALVVNQTQEGNRIVIEAPSARNRAERRQLRQLGLAVGELHRDRPASSSRSKRAQETGASKLQDLQGTIDMNSGDGRIVASNVDGQVKAHTGDGLDSTSIRPPGRVDADSGDGSIEIAGRLDELTVRTGDGSVRVDACERQRHEERLANHDRRRPDRTSGAEWFQRRRRRIDG